MRPVGQDKAILIWFSRPRKPVAMAFLKEWGRAGAPGSGARLATTTRARQGQYLPNPSGFAGEGPQIQPLPIDTKGIWLVPGIFCVIGLAIFGESGGGCGKVDKVDEVDGVDGVDGRD